MISNETHDETNDPDLASAWMVIAYRAAAEGLNADEDDLSEWLRVTTQDPAVVPYVLCVYRNMLAELVSLYPEPARAAFYEAMAAGQLDHFLRAGSWQNAVREALMEHPSG